MWGRIVAGLVLVVGVLSVNPTTSYAAPAAARATPCSAGLVALTFDDGPSSSVTPRLLAILRQHGVLATFFMVGERVAAAPAAARAVAAAGHVVANHTWHHTLMTSQTDAQIRAALFSTDRALRGAGVTPSRLMRPPYGGVNTRVRIAIASAGFVPVLWDVDPEDWKSRSTRAIADSVIAGLRRNRSNVVLQHDGVGNSPASVAAVPAIIKRARSLGYCFGPLGANGKALPPVPRATMTVSKPREGRDAVVRLRLDQPTSRMTTVLLSTSRGSATAADFHSRRVRVRFPAGSVRQTVRIRTRQDRIDEPTESFLVRLRSPRGMTARKLPRRVRIQDDDRAPGVRVRNLAVTEPTTGSATAGVRITLSRASGKKIRVTLRTRAGTARSADFTPVRTTVVIPARRTEATFPVTILADAREESPEAFTVEITAATHARIVRGTAKVTISPAALPPEPASPAPETVRPGPLGPAPAPSGRPPARH